MSETVIIDDTVVPTLETDYKLDSENVNALSGDAKKLANEYLIPFLFSGYPRNFKKNSDAGIIRIRTRRLLSVNADKFDSEEEYESYKKYMDIILDKIRELDVRKTVDNNSYLKNSTEIFGITRTKKETGIDGKKVVVEDKSQNTLYQNLENKEFRDLTNPAKLGAGYTGNTEEGMKFRGKLERGADAKDLLDRKKLEDNLKMSSSGDTAKYTLEIKQYYSDLFNDMGMDVDDNFATTARRKDTQYQSSTLETLIKTQLEPVKGKNPTDIVGFKTTYNTNKTLKVGQINADGDYEYELGEIDDAREKAMKELFQEKNKKALLDLFLEGDISFFKPVGDDQRININDIIVEITYPKKVVVTQTNELPDLKLTSKKQFAQTSGMEGIVPIAKVGSINKLMRSLDRYISRL